MKIIYEIRTKVVVFNTFYETFQTLTFTEMRLDLVDLEIRQI